MIWNLDSQNKDIISKHAFWEIMYDQSAKLWDEAWQQRTKLKEMEGLRNKCQKAEEGLNHVNDYWHEG